MDFVSLPGLLFGSVLMWFVCLFGLGLFLYELSFGSAGFNLFCFVCLTFVGFVGLLCGWCCGLCCWWVSDLLCDLVGLV